MFIKIENIFFIITNKMAHQYCVAFPYSVFYFLKSRDENFKSTDIYQFIKEYHPAGILMNKDTVDRRTIFGDLIPNIIFTKNEIFVRFCFNDTHIQKIKDLDKFGKETCERFFKGTVDEFEVVKEDESIDIITGQRLLTLKDFMSLLPFPNTFVY
jgi:hypothetical protein